MNNILLTFLLHSVNNNNCKRKLCNIFILLNFDNEKKKVLTLLRTPLQIFIYEFSRKVEF